MRRNDRRTCVRIASALAGAALLSIPLWLHAGDKPPLDKSQVGTVLVAARERLGKCGYLGEGKVTVVFRIGEDGKVSELVVKPPHDEQPVGKCVGGIIRGLVFPENDGSTPAITYPVVIKAKSKDGSGRYGTSL